MILTAHEHLGYGRLSYANGTFAQYDSDPRSLAQDLERLSMCAGRRVAGAILYPQMPYRQYSRPGEYDISTDEINSRFFAMVDGWATPITKYPFLYLRVRDPMARNAALMRKYAGRYYGIKLHLDAECAEASDLLDSGILDLAQEYDMPITAHGSRAGGRLDFPKLRAFLLDEIGRRSIRFDFAHAGFLDPDLVTAQVPDTLYFDLSPLGILRDQYLLQQRSEEEFCDVLLALISAHPSSVMYGGDFPYHRQVWEDGSRHGLDRAEELSLLQKTLHSVDSGQLDAFYFRNAEAFLFKTTKTERSGQRYGQ